MNFLLRTKRNENWTFWGSPFPITTWLVYVIVQCPDQGPGTQKNTLEYYWQLWFQNSTCQKKEKTFLVRRVHQKLAFLTHLIAHAWIQNTTSFPGSLAYLRINFVLEPRDQTQPGSLFSLPLYQPRPQGFSLKKWVGREKALASAGHVYSLNIPEKLIYMQPAGFCADRSRRD